MTINEMKRKDFEALPYREWNEDIGVFDSLVVLPLRTIHDSGYRCMDFIACKGNEAVCRLSGCSDVVHINGIGGDGKDWLDKYGRVPDKVPKIPWSIDCLPKSGLLRLFASGNSLEAGYAVSSFEIFAIKE